MLRNNNISADYLNQVVVEAKKTFVAGLYNDAQFKIKAAANPQQVKNYNIPNRGYVSMKDELFAGDAVRIPRTNFIASAGPTSATLKTFIADITRNSISQIVCMAAVLAYDDQTYQDFHDYCMKERTINHGDYQVAVKLVEGLTSQTVSGHQNSPKSTILSTLSISEEGKSTHAVNVTLFAIYDNKPIILKGSSDKNLEFMWELFQKSLKQPILVHCAGGVGRTGHFILTMEILKYYDEIFSVNNPVESAKRIHQLLKNMREVRPALVNTADQFTQAICNAHAVYQYALDNKLVQTAEVRVSEVSMFSNVAQNRARASVNESKPLLDNAEQASSKSSCCVIL